jgi:hypothetical protein
MRHRNTCPTCREVLFNNSEADRGPIGAARIQLVAEAFSRSGLATAERIDLYSNELSVDILHIQRAAADAYAYLASESHPRVTEDAVINTRTLAPHVVAMGNLLRAYAEAAGRPWSRYQRRDWKLIVGCFIDQLLLTNSSHRTGYDVAHMAQEYRTRVKESLTQGMIDVHSGRFFEVNARMDSPCGDLDVLLDYIVFQSAKAHKEQQVRSEELIREQQEALQQETTAVGYGLRWLGQALFGGI